MKLLILFILSFNLLAAKLTIKVNNLNKKTGQIGVAIFDKAEQTSFPKRSEDAIFRNFFKLEELPIQVDLPASTYAISIFHDLNNDMDLNTNAVGIPAEPFGFSNNPTLLFGPPSFSKSQIILPSSGKSISIDLKTF